MGHQSLGILLGTLLVAAVGCDASVKLDSEPVPTTSTPVVEKATAENVDTEATSNGNAEVASAVDNNGATVVGMDDFKKGKRLRDSKYQLSRAVAVRFTVEQKLILMNKDHALDLYNAEHGYFPKTHEEFMDKIIKFNQIKLPELEPGFEYLYKPEDPKNLYQVPVADAGESE